MTAWLLRLLLCFDYVCYQYKGPCKKGKGEPLGLLEFPCPPGLPSGSSLASLELILRLMGLLLTELRMAIRSGMVKFRIVFALRRFRTPELS